jgi:chromosome segregation protein
VERQVNSLKRQAQKARRYRRLREEMRNLQKLTFTADYHRLNAAIERVAADFESAGASQRDLDARLVERESEYRAVSAEARGAEDGLSSLRGQAAAVELEADRARNRRAFEEQQLKELSARIEELERDQQALTERLSILESEAERRAADLKSLETEVSFEQIDLLDRESEYQGELARLREAESAIEQLRQRLVSEIGQTERLRNTSASLEDTLRRVDLKQSNLHSEMERAEARQSEASSEYARAGSEVEGNRAVLADLTARLSERSTRLSALREQNSDYRSRLSAIHGERTSAEHRLLSLEEVDAHRSYYSDAVQQVLSPEHSALINGLGTLADFVEVEAQYECLIESLFGRELQCVLVPTIDDALAGVEYIKASELGRGAFLVVGLHGGEGEPSDFLVESPGDGAATEMISIDRQLPPARSLDADAETELYSDNRSFAEEIFDEKRLDGAPGVSYGDAAARAEESVAEENLAKDRARREQFDREATVSAGRFQLDVLRAIDLLRLRPEIKTVVERAFPEKCAASVVPDIEAALQLSIENASRVYVTYEGEQVVNGRLIVTGARAGQKGTSLLGLKREIKELRVKTGSLRAEEQELSDHLAEAQRQFEEVEGEASSLDLELRQHEKAVAARDSQLEGLARDLERARQHVRVIEAELEQTADERLELESRILEIGGELMAAEASRDIVQESLTSAQSAFIEMRGRLEQMSEHLSSARASVAARVERLQAARSEMRRIDNESEELRGRINRNRLELYESHGRAEQLTASRSEAEAAAARFEAERAGLADEIAVAGEALAGARARADDLEKMLTELRQAASAAHERRGQIEVERARIESEAEHLTRSCFSELAMSLEDVVTSVELGQAARLFSTGDEPPLDETETAGREAEPQTSDWRSGVDIDAAKARLDELRVKLDEMGPVNMMALEELEESEQRFTFLSEQRRDILDSIKLTEEALAEIKRRSRERFRHAFTHVNRNFQQMFVELFGGGRGEMILIDEEDVLESGIDLIAQPPGKRLQNVLLLSGGEKAMAAIALVLSIFQYRPSPFCILDEVDAPLDEMNVGRFSNKVLEMSAGTQFLVITHNKRTMEAARALYGVTMEELGVSKLVSVKFE